MTASSLDDLQKLYDSEINFEISTFWDGGFDWRLGDTMNGYVAEGIERTIAGAVKALADAAVANFPDSAFAKGKLTAPIS